MSRRNRNQRRGMALALFILSLVALFSFLALAIDLGMIAIARTQCQDAADAAAMAGTRTLNGMTANGANNNYSNVSTNVLGTATLNNILGKSITSTQVSYQIGRYTYVAANQRFEGQIPGPTGENWNMVQATVASNITSQLAFSRMFNLASSNISAKATAIHRPRDIAIILDYSGSMRFASLLSTPISGNRSTNNPDTVVPTFGHYSSGSGSLTATSFDLPNDPANISATTSDGRSPICADFYSDANGTAAWTAASSSYASTPGGINFLKANRNSSSTYAKSVYDYNNNSSTTYSNWETKGYTEYNSSLNSADKLYVQGPGYWGKTFFLWPPDPRTSSTGTSDYDWRHRFFNVTDNTKLWDSSGNWRAPSSSTYTIQYDDILAWIKATPCPFPSRLQSGRILYYDSIPNSISTSSWPPSDLNQRFWKDYIDYCLGLMQTGSSSWTIICGGSTGWTGYGADFSFTSSSVPIKISAKPSGAYMDYKDNPKRPLQRFWFGPLSMVDFLGNYNLWAQVDPDYSRYCWWPGTCHEAPMYACKLGIRAALTDIQNNHPNDFVSLIMFDRPKTSSSDDLGRFNRVRVPLGRDYSSMQDALWYPPTTIGNASATIRPYDSDNAEVPRARGGTCYSMGLMLAYNQFSGNSSLKTYNSAGASGDAGGNGRKGAQKFVIFETDGAPNTTASASFTSGGSYQSYYNVRYNSSGSGEYPSNVSGYSDNNSTVTSQVYSLCTRLAALDSASSPGYSTTSKPLRLHCLGFGPVFDPSSGTAATATATLSQMQTLGNVTDGMPSYKLIYGTQSQIVSNLQEAIKRILQNGVQVSLIQ